MTPDLCELRFPHISVVNDYLFILRVKSDQNVLQYSSTVLLMNTFIGGPVRLGLVLE